MDRQLQIQWKAAFAPVQSSILQRKCACGGTPGPTGECEACRKKREAGMLQRSASHAAVVNEVPPIVHEVLRSRGQPLDPATRTFMEPRFGHDFSQVRVHTDSQAVESARAINARAYTVGPNVVFGSGQYAPHSTRGQHLLAHELTHVTQQAQGGRTTAPQAKLEMASVQDATEQEADKVADRVTAGKKVWADRQRGVHLQQVYPGKIQRSPDTPETSSRTAPKLRHHGLTDSEKNLLNQVRQRLVGNNERATAIVGVLITEDGKQFELRSGGGQGFSSHVEGKATAKMNELGITKATLLVEKEPCQICDRSVYPQETGPETPLKSSRTGKEISRQTPKINTALPIGSELTVVDPESASTYRGVKSVSAPVKPANLKFKAEGTAKQVESKVTQEGKSPVPKSNASTVVEDASKAGRAPSKIGGVQGPAAAPGTSSQSVALPKSGAATKESLSEARLAARTAAKEISANYKILRVAKGLTAALHIISFISTLQTLDSFTKMTMNSLAGKGFILTKEIAEAEKLEKEAKSLNRDYPAFSEALTAQQENFFRAAVDPLSAGRAASSISDLLTKVDSLKLDLPDRLKRINAALKEAKTKQKAAEAILSDPNASAAIAAVTFGTAELASLFAASQDMQRIAGALRSASTYLTKIKNQVDDDAMFLNAWFDSLFEICRKNGICSQTTINIPFVGTSNIRGLPGDE